MVSCLQQHGRRTTGGRLPSLQSTAGNGPGDGYDFAEGSEVDEMDPEQLAALKEEVGVYVMVCQRRRERRAVTGETKGHEPFRTSLTEHGPTLQPGVRCAVRTLHLSRSLCSMVKLVQLIQP